MSLLLNDIEPNKNKIAIVVVGYNRIDAIKRLYRSLENASYPHNNIPLIISIDCSGNQELYDYVNSIKWPHGDLFVNIQETRLGLKQHILQCGDLTKYFRGIILLEDDIYVSNDFYNYTIAALDKYENEPQVAGIALYSSEYTGQVNLPFQPLNNGSDSYAYQTVCSWGQCWNHRMWYGFREWLGKWDEDFDSIDMPSRIKKWTKAWSKYFFAYEVLNDLYFIVPYVSLATCFNDVGGEHGGGYSANQQVSLQRGLRKYNFYDFSKLVKYDVFAQNLMLYEAIGLKSNELCLDLYGITYIEEKQKSKRYLLTINKQPFKIINNYGLQLRPIEQNILDNVEGVDIMLYDTASKTTCKKELYPQKVIEYFLKNFNSKFLVKYSIKYIIGVVSRRIKGFLSLLIKK